MTLPAGRIPGPLGISSDADATVWPYEPDLNGRRGKRGGGDDPIKPKGPPAFKNIDRALFNHSLEERVEEPLRIDQRPSSLCGPASLMFLTARRWRGEYKRFVSELYENGKSRIGGLKIEPGAKCKDYLPHQMKGADWVALASVRDSENIIWNYDEESDKVGGITLPSTLEGWLEDVGFNAVENDTNLYLTKGEDNFRDAVRLAASGWGVCLLVNADIVRGTPLRNAMEQAITIPNHWVVLLPNDVVQFVGDAVDFKVFSWGDHLKVGGPTATLTMENWLQNYYGYVAAKTT